MNEVPRNLFLLILRHLKNLQDQKSVSETSKKFNRWAYTCQMWCVTEPVRLEEETKKTKNIKAKVQLIRERVRVWSESQKQSTLLGRRFFREVLRYPIGFIRKGVVGENLLSALKETPDIVKIIDDEIAMVTRRKEFVEAYEQGRMKEYIENNKEGMIRGYRLEQFMYAKEVQYLDEMPQPDDEALMEHASFLAIKWLNSGAVEETLEHLQDTRRRVI